jgi:hypothetical protein
MRLDLRTCSGMTPERKKKHLQDCKLYRQRYLAEIYVPSAHAISRQPTRHEKTARNDLALVQLGCAWLWLS